LLHYAAGQKNLEIFNYIAIYVNKYDEKDNNGENPLHYAVMNGTYHIVEALLKVYKSNKLEIDHKNNVKY
jgi:ankyrin repeat protein